MKTAILLIFVFFLFTNNTHAQVVTERKTIIHHGNKLGYPKNLRLLNERKIVAADTNKYFLAVKKVFEPDWGREFLKLDSVVDLPNGGKFVYVFCNTSNTMGSYKYYYFKNKAVTFPYMPVFLSQNIYAVAFSNKDNTYGYYLYNNQNKLIKIFKNCNFILDPWQAFTQKYCIDDRIIYAQSTSYVRLGLINSRGTIIASPSYRTLERFRNNLGLFIAKKQNKKYIVIDKNNSVIVPEGFEAFYSLSENYFIGAKNISTSSVTYPQISSRIYRDNTVVTTSADYYIFNKQGKIIAQSLDFVNLQIPYSEDNYPNKYVNTWMVENKFIKPLKEHF